VVDFDVLFGSGIDQLGCLLDAAEGVGVVSRRGAYYQFGEVKLGQGRTQACASLKESSALLDQVVSAVKTATANRATDFAPNVFASIGGGGTGGGAAIGGLGSGSISDGAE
jgi:recombination protein RecA